MGHLTSTDLEALESAAATVWELARTYVFTGADEFLKTFPQLTVEAPSFRIEFQLQHDVIDAASDRVRTMVALRFTHLPRREDDPDWALYVRGHWPDRTDRFPTVGRFSARRLRRWLAPRQQPAGAEYRFAVPNDDVYLMETTPAVDVIAQLCVFVLQTELSIDAELMPWLVQYIEKTFAIANDDARSEIAMEVTLRLIQNKWWMENVRTWRHYIKSLLRVIGGKYVIRSAEVPAERGDGMTEDKRIQAIEGGAENDDEPSMIRSAPILDMTKHTFSAQEASQHLGVSVGTVYSRIHKRQLDVQRVHGQFVISKSELDRATREPRLRDVIDAVAAARRCKREAARRQVHRLRRRGLTLDRILDDARTHQKNFDEAGRTRGTPGPGHALGQCTATSVPRLRCRNQHRPA
jgi:excisionase family DNA binding protein